VSECEFGFLISDFSNYQKLSNQKQWYLFLIIFVDVVLMVVSQDANFVWQRYALALGLQGHTHTGHALGPS
jgi:hypothetical protein